MSGSACKKFVTPSIPDLDYMFPDWRPLLRMVGFCVVSDRFLCPRTCALLWRALLVGCRAPSLEDATAMTRRPDKALGRRECRSGLPRQISRLASMVKVRMQLY